MSYKQLKKAEIILLAIGGPLLLIGGYYRMYLMFFAGVFVISLIAGLEIAHAEYWFCPHCGKLIYRNYGDYCQNCGWLIEWKDE